MMNSNFHLILASKSPRRRQILSDAGFQFTVRSSGYDETFPAEIPPEKMAAYLSEQKAEYMKDGLKDDEIILTADTVVICDNQILGKPADAEEAYQMLKSLSDKEHLVITACTLLSKTKKVTFDDTTGVRFRKLEDSEIEHYIKVYEPYDKAGSYGIQEWLGMIGIENINGSYFNVVGLPIHKVYTELLKFD